MKQEKKTAKQRSSLSKKQWTAITVTAILVLAAILAAGTVIFNRISAQKEREGKLYVALECNNPPFSCSQIYVTDDAVPILDSHMLAVGTDVAAAKELAAALKRELVIVKAARGELAETVRSGEADLAFSSFSDAEAADCLLSQPYYRAETALVVRTGDRYTEADSLSALSGLRLAAQAGTPYTVLLQQIADVDAVAADSVPQMRELLKTGGIHGFITDFAQAEECARLASECTVVPFSGIFTEEAGTGVFRILAASGSQTLMTAVDAWIAGQPL